MWNIPAFFHNNSVCIDTHMHEHIIRACILRGRHTHTHVDSPIKQLTERKSAQNADTTLYRWYKTTQQEKLNWNQKDNEVPISQTAAAGNSCERPRVAFQLMFTQVLFFILICFHLPKFSQHTVLIRTLFINRQFLGFSKKINALLRQNSFAPLH